MLADDTPHDRTLRSSDATEHATVPTTDRTATPVAGDPFTPDTVTQVTTERSVWLFRPDRSATGGAYLRMPRTEAPRPATFSDWDRLEDGTWLAYEYARWTDRGLAPGELRLNIKPVIGPVDGVGIFTGCVVAMDRQRGRC